jgi:virginiamycin B lyase
MFLLEKSLRHFFPATLLAAFLAPGGCAGTQSADRGMSALPINERPVARSARPMIGTVFQFPGAPEGAGFIASDGKGSDWFGVCKGTIARIYEPTDAYSKFYSPGIDSCQDAVALGRHRTAMWFASREYDKIGFIWLKSHRFRSYKVPNRFAQPLGITAGSDNAMWFTETFGGYSNSHGAIGRVDLSSRPYLITEYKLPYNGGVGSPYLITLGSDGALWFTDRIAEGIGRINTSYKISFYSLPQTNPVPSGITSGPDGALWFTEVDGPGGSYGRVGRIDPVTHSISEWKLANDSHPSSIVSLNSDLWFTETTLDRFGCINTSTHQINEYDLPKGSNPVGVTVGTDGWLWITEPGKKSLATYLPPGPCAN